MELPEQDSNTVVVETQLEIWGNSHITEVLSVSKQQNSHHMILKELMLSKTEHVENVHYGRSHARQRREHRVYLHLQP